jgi:hypothetical protein
MLGTNYGLNQANEEQPDSGGNDIYGVVAQYLQQQRANQSLQRQAQVPSYQADFGTSTGAQDFEGQRASGQSRFNALADPQDYYPEGQGYLKQLSELFKAGDPASGQGVEQFGQVAKQTHALRSPTLANDPNPALRENVRRFGEIARQSEKLRRFPR